MQLMNDNGMSEVEWEKNGERLSIRSTPASTQSPAVMQPAAVPPPQAPTNTSVSSESNTKDQQASTEGTTSSSANHKQIHSPFVGTFYRSPSPGSEPYVKEGSQVKPGDLLCIVEAMKLMNEIESEYSGKIVSVLVENGEPVEFGEPLFVIEVDA